MAVSDYLKHLPKSLSNGEYGKQLTGSSSSIGVNYIEAIEALGRKDLMMKIRMSRKEARESAYWLRLIIETNNGKLLWKRKDLHNEANELKKILSSILVKSK
jgi:four helix bundle protein